jgi:hypothetical protein
MDSLRRSNVDRSGERQRSTFPLPFGDSKTTEARLSIRRTHSGGELRQAAVEQGEADQSNPGMNDALNL